MTNIYNTYIMTQLQKKAPMRLKALSGAQKAQSTKAGARTRDGDRLSGPRMPEREAAQNLEFAAGFALGEKRQRVDTQGMRSNPTPELPFQGTRHAISIENGVGQGKMGTKFVEHVRVAPSLEVVRLAWRQARRPSPLAFAITERRAQRVKRANDAPLE